MTLAAFQRALLGDEKVTRLSAARTDERTVDAEAGTEVGELHACRNSAAGLSNDGDRDKVESGKLLTEGGAKVGRPDLASSGCDGLNPHAGLAERQAAAAALEGPRWSSACARSVAERPTRWRRARA